MELDQFIAAVEMLQHPELRERPVMVGRDGDHGQARSGEQSILAAALRPYGAVVDVLGWDEAFTGIDVLGGQNR